MPQMINWKNTLIRINPINKNIECSTTNGSSWACKCSSNSCYGIFIDLCPFGDKIFACTTKGVFCSTTNGSSWACKCSNNSCYGEFQQIIENGGQLFATTTKGLFYSNTQGSAWAKKG